MSNTGHDLVDRYLAWLADAPARHPERADALLSDDFHWTEMPTPFARNGRSGDRQTLLAALADAESMLEEEELIPLHVTGNAERVIVELSFRARPRGAAKDLRASGVMSLDLRDGRIAAQRDYLCFDAVR